MQRGDRHRQLRCQVRKPPFISAEMILLSHTLGQWSGADATIAQEATEDANGELLRAFGRLVIFGIQSLGDRAQCVAFIEQRLDSSEHLVAVGQLLVRLNGATHPMVTDEATLPMNVHIDTLAVAFDVHDDFIDQDPGDRAAVFRRGRVGMPQPRQARGQQLDLTTLVIGELRRS